ncbi:hypothetical protein [Streptomyces niveus]|uniref:hypothetical protein n=1 Tax=Streptomyces niveus TaxID=193462 RepID=UPI00364EC5A7
MPATVHPGPLGGECVLPGGVRRVIVLAGTRNEQLAEDLATGLARAVHPHGTIAAFRTAGNYGAAIRRMVDALTDDGFTGGASELTRARKCSAGTRPSGENAPPRFENCGSR